jgi:hypothetical protein
MSFILAFSSSVRHGLFFIQSCISFVSEYVWTYLVTATGVYGLLAGFRMDSRDILASRDKHVAHLKAKALQMKQAKRDAREKRKAKELADRRNMARVRIRTASKHLV